jgi:hypothetical protein
MVGKMAQVDPKPVHHDDRGGLANRLSRRDAVVGVGRLRVSTVGVALLGGCQIASRSTVNSPGVRGVKYLDPASRSGVQTVTVAFTDQLRQHGGTDGENLMIDGALQRARRR